LCDEVQLLSVAFPFLMVDVLIGYGEAGFYEYALRHGKYEGHNEFY